MNFGLIVSRSFEVIWRFKSLWIIGLLAGIPSSLNTDPALAELIPTDIFMSPEELMASIPPGFYLLMAIFAVVYLLFDSIFGPALIDAVNNITRGGEYSFGSAFSRGVDVFLRYLGITILSVVAMFGGFFLAAFFFVLGPLGAVVAVPLMVIWAVCVVLIMSLAHRALVVRDVPIADTIEEGYKLFRSNLGACVSMFFITLGLGLAIIIGLAIVALFTLAPLNAFLTTITENKFSLFLMAVVLGLPFSIVFSGATTSLFSTLFTLFYFELVEPNGPALHSPLDQAPQQPPPPGHQPPGL